MIEVDAQLIRTLAADSKRLDERAADEYRQITITPNVISSAEGSAHVKVGDTQVIAGVKIDIGTPFPDTPDEGVIIVAVELVPLASIHFESGPPRQEAIELSRVVDRAIRESKAIDFKKMAIDSEKGWMINVDIDVLNDDGNLFDACGIAAVVALHMARLPELEDGKVVYEKKGTKRLPITGIPLSTTFAKIGKTLVADPTFVEMQAMHARLTVGTIEKNGKMLLCSMQKGGDHGLTEEEIYTMIDMAEQKGTEIRSLVEHAIKKH